MLGPKSMRGEYHVIRRRPRAVFGAISLLWHVLWTRRRPGLAAALLCIKQVGVDDAGA
jgi:hypothetical protein